MRSPRAPAEVERTRAQRRQPIQRRALSADRGHGLGVRPQVLRAAPAPQVPPPTSLRSGGRGLRPPQAARRAAGRVLLVGRRLLHPPPSSPAHPVRRSPPPPRRVFRERRMPHLAPRDSPILEGARQALR